MDGARRRRPAADGRRRCAARRRRREPSADGRRQATTRRRGRCADETDESRRRRELATPASPASPKPLGAELEALRTELDERTRDLQRVSAEYANYRKRVERDRGAVVEQATASVRQRAAAGARRPRPGPGARRPGRPVRARWPSSSTRRWPSSA